MKNTVKTRCVYAKALQSKLFANRIVAPKKGKGSYKRSKKVAA
jgi:stalled ribosome alternative rescue factor ArfA